MRNYSVHPGLLKNQPIPRYHYRIIILTAVGILLALSITAVAAALPGSDFEGDDGNLVVDGLGRGWVDAPNMEDPAIDKLSRTGDDSF